jgi:hypothetical protein
MLRLSQRAVSQIGRRELHTTRMTLTRYVGKRASAALVTATTAQPLRVATMYHLTKRFYNGK